MFGAGRSRRPWPLLKLHVGVGGNQASQPSVGSCLASHPKCMLNRTAPGELSENQFMLAEYPHTLISTAFT